jgi:hypothetical protein
MDPSHIPPFSCLQQMMAGGLACEFDLTRPVSPDGSQSEFSAAGRVLASKKAYPSLVRLGPMNQLLESGRSLASSGRRHALPPWKLIISELFPPHFAVRPLAPPGATTMSELRSGGEAPHGPAIGEWVAGAEQPTR